MDTDLTAKKRIIYNTLANVLLLVYIQSSMFIKKSKLNFYS